MLWSTAAAPASFTLKDITDLIIATRAVADVTDVLRRPLK